MKKTRYILYAVCLPVDLIAWFLVICVRFMWGENLRWENGGLWCNLRENSWPKKKPDKKSLNPYKRFAGWYIEWAGTVFGHGGMYGNPLEQVKFHENVHVNQFEAYTLKLLFVLVTIKLLFIFIQLHWVFIITFFIWGNGFSTWFSNWVQAKLRGKDNYKDSIHEMAAYSYTETHFKRNK